MSEKIDRPSPAIIAEHRLHDTDTGSPEVQIALLTARINHLNEHLQGPQEGPPQPARPADAGRPRRRLLDYVRKNDVERYRAIIASTACAAEASTPERPSGRSRRHTRRTTTESGGTKSVVSRPRLDQM